MNSILVVEDEEKLANFLLRGLKNEGYQCEWVDRAELMLSFLENKTFDLILLDRILYGIDTINLLPEIRRKQSSSMVLILTALHDIEEKIHGLRAGADDYLAKPFDFEELLARIEALIRRSDKGISVDNMLSRGLLRMNVESQRVWINDQEVELTQLEFQLLRYFLSNPDRVLSRERILSKVWGNTSDPMTNIVDVYIRRLRKKLLSSTALQGEVAADCFIHTLRGMGYRLGPCR
ncbi:response regulator transcription factor [Marinibactrum halimedae]|uniref:DNA-binding response regulator n=1 Tax=Marinibactrum halimedae TaxID=1444977 RepID=A0AA37T0J2_9GAMM|nr:response regulator transcription factor [Marinibactrum halimedae]MCD9459702.1 response regulator transcription factor [Marinibactrum halimedae]GLS24540.1 DNA-binding response regulator [Marinibactrum halimedae]